MNTKKSQNIYHGSNSSSSGGVYAAYNNGGGHGHHQQQQQQQHQSAHNQNYSNIVQNSGNSSNNSSSTSSSSNGSVGASNKNNAYSAGLSSSASATSISAQQHRNSTSSIRVLHHSNYGGNGSGGQPAPMHHQMVPIHSGSFYQAGFHHQQQQQQMAGGQYGVEQRKGGSNQSSGSYLASASSSALSTVVLPAHHHGNQHQLTTSQSFHHQQQHHQHSNNHHGRKEKSVSVSVAAVVQQQMSDAPPSSQKALLSPQLSLDSTRILPSPSNSKPTPSQHQPQPVHAQSTQQQQPPPPPPTKSGVVQDVAHVTVTSSGSGSTKITTDEVPPTKLSTSSSESYSSSADAGNTATCDLPESPVTPHPPLSEQSQPPSRLADMLRPQQDYEDRFDYCRDLVRAIDCLYPNDKWPLHVTWTLWFIKNDSQRDWLDNLKPVADVSYVEDFWSVYCHVLTPSRLANMGDMAFFKKGIRPMWEDEENKSGGGWLHQVPISGTQQQQGPYGAQRKSPAGDIDDLWRESLMALIGDNFCGDNSLGVRDDSAADTDHLCDNISGIYVSRRHKNDKLTLWTKNFRDEKSTRLIGKIWKHLLKLSEAVTITFEAHETKNSKNANFKIVYKE